MKAKMYSQHLGVISDEQFQAALDRFELGRFIQAEPIPFLPRLSGPKISSPRFCQTLSHLYAA
jgi:hypothetical protein